MIETVRAGEPAPPEHPAGRAMEFSSKRAESLVRGGHPADSISKSGTRQPRRQVRRAGPGMDSPTAASRPSIDGWSRGAADFAKEGGDNGVAPQEDAARVQEAACGALVGTGPGRDPARGRLPGGIWRDDAAVGPV